ncbi:MAG: hypothetical protein JNK53_08600 [Phycisphaerae bacterium]|nr:hypothetical protein [Phycisphaerae bacterium]
MATKTKASTTTRKNKPKAGAKAGSAGASASGPGVRRGRKHSVAFDIRHLVTEVRDLRTLREKYNKLVHEHHGLLGTLKDLSAELGTSARKAWGSYRNEKGAPAPTASGYRTRVRASSNSVDTQYDKLVAVIPTAWTSKNDICKAAGLDPRQSNTAFRRLVTGFKRDGKNHPARLESNGKRGTEGRYRKA